MKVAAVILLSCLALASSSRPRYPGSYPNSGGGGSRPIIFPGENKGGSGHVGSGGVGGHIHPQQPGGVGGGIVGGGFSAFPAPIGHGGEQLFREACRPSNSLVHDTFQGHNYHFSWCADGGQRYVWEAARDYCTNLGPGWYPVAIESSAEDNFIINIVGTHRSPWIWTGGNRLNNNHFNWEWLDGSRVGYTNWGRTGSENLPQPDNAENNNERCLGVLNQFYAGDLITWHDIGCHHTKPTICENSGSGQVTVPQYG